MRQSTQPNGNELPRIGITMGDPAGIGPEIIVKALAHNEVYESARPLVIGDVSRLKTAAKILNSPVAIHPVTDSAIGLYQPGRIDCVDLRAIPDDLPFGRVSPIAGEAAFRYVEKAASLALTDSIDAICTAPLSKEAMHAAGHRFPGHTELLAHLTGTPEVSMMLAAPGLRVVHVTTHIGLLDAIEKIEPGLVERVIARGHEVLVRAGIARPKIGVCAINSHAGENGLFGRGEEAAKITPAIEACQRRGWDVRGPLPADTLFFLAGRGDYDMVVAMYHDQG